MLTAQRTMIMTGMILLVMTAVFAQPRKTAQGIWEAKLLIKQGSNTSSKEQFEQAEKILLQCASQDERPALIDYYLGYIDYNMAVVINRMDKEKAVPYLESAVEHLETAIQHDGQLAEAHALLSSCYGMQISFSPYKGIWLGPKSGREKDKAKQLAPANPRVALLGAIGTYNTPPLFGGGKERGLEELKKAAELFGRWEPADSLQPDWGKEQVYAWIGLAYLDRNETILARQAFEKALAINPAYGWVKYVLMPKVTSGVSSH
jgi:tetratricopeptide (TPR) repeat protein